MRRDAIDCDGCGARDIKGDSFSIAIDSYTDAAGDTDTHTLDFDLCTGCQTRVLKQTLKKFVDWNKEDALEVAQGFKNRVRII